MLAGSLKGGSGGGFGRDCKCGVGRGPARVRVCYLNFGAEKPK